jgi:hypothetical protein
VIGFFTGLLVWLWSIFDAYQGAESYNAGQVVVPNAMLTAAAASADGVRAEGVRLEVTVPRTLNSGQKIKSAVEPLIAQRPVGELTVSCENRRGESWFVRLLVEIAKKYQIRSLVIREVQVDTAVWTSAEQYARQSGVHLVRGRS